MGFKMDSNWNTSSNQLPNVTCAHDKRLQNEDIQPVLELLRFIRKHYYSLDWRR